MGAKEFLVSTQISVSAAADAEIISTRRLYTQDLPPTTTEVARALAQILKSVATSLTLEDVNLVVHAFQSELTG